MPLLYKRKDYLDTKLVLRAIVVSNRGMGWDPLKTALNSCGSMRSMGSIMEYGECREYRGVPREY